MKFRVNQVILNSALQTISKIANTKTAMQTQNAMVLTVDINKVKLSACDGKNSIETEAEAFVEQSGKILLPHNLMSELVKKLPVMDINFTLEETGNLLILAGRSKYRIMSYTNENYQLLQMDENETDFVSIDAAALSHAIEQVKFAISKDQNRLILTGALFEFKERVLKLVAIDGYRMASKEIEIFSKINRNIVITEKALLEVQRLISTEGIEKLNMTVSDKKVKFEIGGTTLISSLISGDFISYENIVPRETKSDILVNKTEFENAVDRTTVIIANNQNKVIKLNIKDDEMVITTDSDSGKAEEFVEIKLEGEDLLIGFNPRFILDALKVMEGDELIVKFTNPKGPCIIKTSEKDDYFCLLLPCSI